MSYRNPTQVVDTQTGQHYANLQKTIAGSFGNYANAVSAAAAKANDKRRKEEIENQKAGIAIRNKMFEDHSPMLRSHSTPALCIKLNLK